MTASPVPGFIVSTPYGKRPNDSTYWRARGYHTGDDYAVNRQTGIRCVAVLDGRVTTQRDTVLGNMAILHTKQGAYVYCHLAKPAIPGQRKAGETVGIVGQTGTGAAGIHLHFEYYPDGWKGWGVGMPYGTPSPRFKPRWPKPAEPKLSTSTLDSIARDLNAAKKDLSAVKSVLRPGVKHKYHDGAVYRLLKLIAKAKKISI